MFKINRLSLQSQFDWEQLIVLTGAHAHPCLIEKGKE